MIIDIINKSIYNKDKRSYYYGTDKHKYPYGREPKKAV